MVIIIITVVTVPLPLRSLVVGREGGSTGREGQLVGVNWSGGSTGRQGQVVPGVQPPLSLTVSGVPPPIRSTVPLGQLVEGVNSSLDQLGQRTPFPPCGLRVLKVNRVVTVVGGPRGVGRGDESTSHGEIYFSIPRSRLDINIQM